MKIEAPLLLHLANLSRLHFNEQQMDSMQSDMEAIIGFVEKLNELDTTGIEPLRFMGELDHPLREDVVAGSVTTAEAFRNAPLHDGVFFKVPKVIAH